MSNKNAIEGWCGLPYLNGLLGRESLLLDGVKEAVHSRSRLPLLFIQILLLKFLFHVFIIADQVL